MASFKIPPPRALQQQETLASLDQFKIAFKLFYKRSPDAREFFKPDATWDPSQPNYGLRDDVGADGLSAADKADNLELLLSQLGNHLPFPFLTPKFVKETRCLEDCWTILYTHYGVQPNQQSFLHYAKLQKKPDESPATFFERLCHHARSHLAPRGATASGITNAEPDQMNISLLNHIALDWLKAMDMVDSVQTEFGNELKGGTQLSALVPRIAHQVETLRRRHGQAQVNHVGSDYQQPTTLPTETDDQVTGVMYVGSIQSQGQYWRPYRGSGRRSRPTFSNNRGGRGQQSRGASSQPVPGRNFCPSCHYLGQELHLQVNTNHSPADCPRRRAALNMVQDDGEFAADQHQDQEQQDLQQAFSGIMLNDHNDEVRSTPSHTFSTHFTSSTSSLSQEIDRSTSPSSEPVKDFNSSLYDNTQTTLPEPIDTSKSWLEDITAKIRNLESRLASNQSNEIRKAKSPTVETLLYGTRIICTVDEGSELNCLDYAIAVPNNIPRPSPLHARSAD